MAPKWSALVVLWLLLLGAEAMANVPASYFACEGLADGYRCRMTGPFFGRCTLDTLCEDDEETESLSSINECLLCVDECWSREIGAQCLIPLNGERGVCEEIPNCTPDDDKSFFVCQRCRSGALLLNEPTEQGCEYQQWLPRTSVCLCLFLLVIGVLARREKRSLL